MNKLYKNISNHRLKIATTELFFTIDMNYHTIIFSVITILLI